MCTTLNDSVESDILFNFLLLLHRFDEIAALQEIAASLQIITPCSALMDEN